MNKSILIYLKSNWYFVILLLFLDQLTKILARFFLSMINSLSFGNIINLKLVYNSGIAFGFFQEKIVLFITIFLTIIILYKLLFDYNVYIFLTSIFKKTKLFNLFYFLLISGIIGNLIDRIFLTKVTDFISLNIIPIFGNYFFNMADIYIFFSIVIIIYYSIFVED